MPIIASPPTGLTPKVAGLHWDDLLGQFRLKISWQIVTPFGTFPQREEVFFYVDLATALNAIKSIWAIVATEEGVRGATVTCPLGDFSAFNDLPEGRVLRTYDNVIIPPPPDLAVSEPDVVTDYDGVADSWGATPP